MRYAILLIAAGAGIMPVRSETTAREALSVLARERGAAVAARVRMVAGERGQAQPAAWRLVTPDPEFAGRMREYVIRDGKIVDERPVAAEELGRIPAAPISKRLFRIDSSQAFAKADAAARKALIGFDSLDYELRNKELSSDPVWVLRLNGPEGRPVGEVVIAASSGQVLRRSWSEREAAGPIAAGPGPDGTRGRIQPATAQRPAGLREQAESVWGRTREGFEHGREAIQTNVKRATHTMRGWFSRWIPGSGREEGEWEEGVYDPGR